MAQGVQSLYNKLKGLNIACAAVAGAILIFITFSIFVDVFMRYVFNKPSVWITEVSTYLFLYITFLGTSYALQRDMHIRVTFLSDLFSARVQRFITFITSVFALVFCFTLVWQTGTMTWRSYAQRWTSPTMLSVPLVYVYIAMFFGSCMLFLTLLLQTLLTYKAPDDGKRGDEE